VAAIASFTIVALTIAEVVLFAILPQPAGIIEWFKRFNDAPAEGILSFWGLELPMYAMFVLAFLGLFATLRRSAPAASAIALAFVLVGAAVFFATNNPSSMMTLARDFAAIPVGESGRVQREALISAGSSVLAQTGQRAVGGFNIALLLVSVAGVICAAAMIRAKGFGRGMGLIGIFAFGLSLGDYVRQALTHQSAVALAVIMPGTLLLVIWFVIVGLRLIARSRNLDHE